MKKRIKQLAGMLLLMACLQTSVQAHASAPVPQASVPPVGYYLQYTFESSYYDGTVYIEYYSYKIVYTTSVTTDMIANYSVFWENTSASGEDNHNAWVPAWSSFTSLGTYETYYHDANSGFMETKYLVVNSVL